MSGDRSSRERSFCKVARAEREFTMPKEIVQESGEGAFCRDEWRWQRDDLRFMNAESLPDFDSSRA
jgi:hypothetical protein